MGLEQNVCMADFILPKILKKTPGGKMPFPFKFDEGRNLICIFQTKMEDERTLISIM